MSGNNSLPITSDFWADKLTKAEMKLLHAIADPDVRVLKVCDICEAADVSLDTYYRAFRKPHFIAAHNALLISIIKMQAVPLVKTGIALAHKGSYPHWKALMEMGGYYSPRMMVGDGDSGEIVIRFVDPRAPQQQQPIDVTPVALPSVQPVLQIDPEPVDYYDADDD